jgi:carbonic anhydrase
LREGNARFVGNDRCIDTYLSHTKLDEHLQGQSPYAVILGCSDSRVPVEIIFDAGLGDLFVIRVAGNIVAPSLIGSIEFAAENFGSRLVVVLGHTGCGAIDATIGAINSPDSAASENISAIVSSIRPGIEQVVNADDGNDRAALVNRAVRENVRAMVASLQHGSNKLEQMISTDGLMVLGADYSLETGVVDYFDGVPQHGSV